MTHQQSLKSPQKFESKIQTAFSHRKNQDELFFEEIDQIENVTVLGPPIDQFTKDS